MATKTAVIFGDEARRKLLVGVNILADAVASSLGPCGQNTAIARATATGEIFDRTVLHDGVSIARAIDLKDEVENMGASLLREAAQKTVDEVGDGTTVSVILAQAIIQECLKIIATGTNPMTLRAGLES